MVTGCTSVLVHVHTKLKEHKISRMLACRIEGLIYTGYNTPINGDWVHFTKTAECLHAGRTGCTSVLVHTADHRERREGATGRRTAIAEQLVTAVRAQRPREVVHDRVDLLPARRALQVDQLVPIELDGVTVEVKLEGKVWRVTCFRCPLVVGAAFDGKRAMLSLALHAVLPLSFVALRVMGPADSVASVVARAVDPRVTAQSVRLFVVADQLLTALGAHERTFSVSAQPALGQGLGIFARLARLPVLRPVGLLAVLRAIEDDLTARAALERALPREFSGPAVFTFAHVCSRC